MRPNSKRYIRFTIDEELPQHSHWGQRARPACGQRCNRCLRFTGFCLVCTGTLFQAVTPWVLSVFEAVGVLLMCLVLVPKLRGPGPPSFDFQYSLEDIALASAIRAAVISGTYAYGMQRQFLRPYLYTTYAASGAGLVYALVKAFYFSYSAAWLAEAGVIFVFGTFSWIHVLAARNVVAWARKRMALGLATFPWEPGLKETLVPSRAGRGVNGTGDGSDDGASDISSRGDVPPELLADPDSNFTPVGELWVHWKEALPPLASSPRRTTPLQPPPPAAATASPLPGGSEDPEATAVLLIHSGGGGAFAWRNLMQDLAARCGVRVVAFDRPGFGLTSRPRPPPAGSGQADPYSPAAQALLVLQLCDALGIKKALLVAHGDGCLVAVMAASLAQRQHGLAPSATPSTGGGGGRISISIPSGLGMRPDSADIGWPSSLGSSEAGSLTNASRAALSDAAAVAAVRQPQQPGLAGTRSGSGGGGGVGAGSSVVTGSVGSERASLAASLSFQSLLGSGENSGALDQPHHQQQQQQQQQHGRPRSRLSQPGVDMGTHEQQQQQQQQEVIHGGASPTAGAAAVVPPELQAMTANIGAFADPAGLAPQLWPRAAQQVQQQGLEQEEQRQAKPSDSSYLFLGEITAPDSQYDLEVVGVALLHPKLSGRTLSGFTRLLARAKLGRAMLRPLLRSEIGEVSNRRAWHRSDRCTRQVLELYRRPLRVEGWDTALLAASLSAEGLKRQSIGRDLAALRQLPVLVGTGSHDRIATPVNVGRLAATVGGRMGMVPGCGHLSHEEAPEALLELLVPFVREVQGSIGC